MTAPRIRVIAHNIRSLWNVGSFFRTCDGMGIERLYLTGYTGIPPRKEITKTALGAEEFVPWEHGDDPLAIARGLRAEGFGIVSLEQTERSVLLHEFQPQFPLCLILGNEIAGVREDLLALSDAAIEIPMLGEKESLNVAVALGVALYALRSGASTSPLDSVRGSAQHDMGVVQPGAPATLSPDHYGRPTATAAPAETR